MVKYFDHGGALVSAYPVDDAVAANNGNWSFSTDHDGGFLIVGAASCASGGKDHFAVEAVGPNGKRWIAKSSDWSACGGSAVVPDAEGGAYLMTAGEDGSIQTLSRLNGDGQLWRTQLPGTSRIDEGVHVDVNGVAVTATVLPYECTPDSPPGSCSGSVLAFIAPDGERLRRDVDIKDPEFISYYQGIVNFALSPGSVFVSRGSGDWHEQTASVSQIAVPQVAADYQAQVAGG